MRVRACAVLWDTDCRLKSAESTKEKKTLSFAIDIQHLLIHSCSLRIHIKTVDYIICCALYAFGNSLAINSLVY